MIGSRPAAAAAAVSSVTCIAKSEKGWVHAA